MNSTFISYRRTDSRQFAVKLKNALGCRIDSDHIFLDEAGIHPSQVYPQRLKSQLWSMGMMMVLIGHTWTTVRAGRTRRLFQDIDWCRIELITAIKRGIPLVPVILKGAKMPTVGDLPPQVLPLLNRQAIFQEDHPSLDSLADKLVTAIKNHGFHISTDQETVFKGKDRDDPNEHWWDWKVFLTGTGPQLDMVREVRFHVGDDWEPPTWQISNRRTKFALNLEGWNDFTIPIDIDLKNGNVVKIKHKLILE